jgi:hypothetical protein
MKHKPGTILCLKTTGELVLILKEIEGNEGRESVLVRRPVMGRDGIGHMSDLVFPFELETVEEHLRGEAKELLLKSKIQKAFFESAQEDEKQEKAEKKDYTVN